MLVDRRGRMNLQPVEAPEATWKLCRIENKTIVRGGKTQINLHDGRNLLLAKDAHKTGTTLKLGVPGQKVLAHFDLAEGATALITGGKHVGELGHVLAVQKTRNPRANVVTFKEGFSTDIDKVFVVGKEAAEVKVPEVSAL
jgi:small subunit ribosomal protein S4e